MVLENNMVSEKPGTEVHILYEISKIGEYTETEKQIGSC